MHKQDKSLSASTSQATTISNYYDEKVPVKNKKKLNAFFNLIKTLIFPCHCQSRKKKPSIKKLSPIEHEDSDYCCYDCNMNSAESMTIVENLSQPWIVPSEYHKHISEPNTEHQWIFRTGWTPQPEPLAFMDSDWCRNCNSFIKKNSIQCPSCDNVDPLGRSKLSLIQEV